MANNIGTIIYCKEVWQGLLKKIPLLLVVAYPFNPSIGKAEAGGSL